MTKLIQEKVKPDEPQTKPRNVYELISAVSAELSGTGIAKKRENTQSHYKFRGIDDVYNALGPALAKHGLVILSKCLSRQETERLSGQGKALFYTTVDMEFEFISSCDLSRHSIIMAGQAMDSGDKGLNKAVSAAYKYAMFLTFCIPVEGDNDADASTYTVEHVKLLSQEQIANIQSAVFEADANIETILKFYRVGSLDQVPDKAFDAIMRSLAKRRLAIAPSTPGVEV